MGAVVSQKAQAIDVREPTGPASAIGTPQAGQASERTASQAARSAGRISTRRRGRAQALVALSGSGVLAGSKNDPTP